MASRLRSTMIVSRIPGLLGACLQLADSLVIATAIRDFAFMRALQDVPKSQASEHQRDLSEAFPEIAEPEGGPFNSRYCSLASTGGIPSDPIRSFLSHVFPRRLTYTKAEMEARFDEFLTGQDPTTISPFVDKLTRFIIAFTGGAALVVPMLIM